MTIPLDGWCDPSFAAVRDAFEQNFTEHGEVGAAVNVIIDGSVVVDLQGGWADAGRAREWAPDTLVDVYSVGKPLVALLALRLVDEGVIGLDDPIVSLWPEFAAAGKDSVTLRQALCHRGGVPAIRERLTNDDLWSWDRMAEALAATEPWWEPGSRHAYHTNTYGHLVGEIVRRGTGRMPGDVLQRLVEPLGADIWFGLPESEHQRCADVVWEGPQVEADFDAIDALEGDERMTFLGYFNPPGYSSMGVVNTAPWRSAQVPSTNGHGTAAGVARVYGALLEPGRLISTELLAEAARPQSTGYCPTLDEDVTFGLGFKPTTERRPLGPNPSSFGHFGTGGAVGFADPDAGVAFGYVMNHVIPRWQSRRNRALIDAVYSCL